MQLAVRADLGSIERQAIRQDPAQSAGPRSRNIRHCSDRKGVQHRFPSMRVEDIDIAAIRPMTGSWTRIACSWGFAARQRASASITGRIGVVDFDIAGKRVAAVRLEPGERLAADSVVNAANCWGPELCDKVGMRVPVYPMRRRSPGTPRPS